MSGLLVILIAVVLGCVITVLWLWIDSLGDAAIDEFEQPENWGDQP